MHRSKTSRKALIWKFENELAPVLPHPSNMKNLSVPHRGTKYMKRIFETAASYQDAMWDKNISLKYKGYT